tara:strand:- start:6022 stop:7209 length:1188 start_codon:yes stop_codon:yes gene_type:complete
MDGAGDLKKIDNKTPLELSRTPNLDSLVLNGYSGLMQTLYDDLPKGSIVSQMGILGFDPYKYYPNGRASCEALALGLELSSGDIAFRANLALKNKNKLESYNANYIKTEDSKKLVKKINNQLMNKFPKFQLHNNSDFRNTLIIRDTNLNPSDLICPEPHENMGNEFDFSKLIKSKKLEENSDLDELNSYIHATSQILENEISNIIFPWSASSPLQLPEFKFTKGSKSAIIGHMDFLHGIAIAAGMEFYNVGNGSWDTDYDKKADQTLELIEKDYEFIYLHINGPDEASHAGKLDKKIFSIEQIDSKILSRIMNYFNENKEELGGILVTTDHYTNLNAISSSRVEAHSSHPVPFVIWNSNQIDESKSFSEIGCQKGLYGENIVNHLNILNLLFNRI